MSAARHPSPSVVVLVAFLAAIAGCSDPTSAPDGTSRDARYAQSAAATTGPTVTSTLPTDAPRDTTLDVQINGSGFDKGTTALLTLHGVVDARVRVNSTRYVKTSQLVANVTIAADAVSDLYDVAVMTAAGKKGIGTELFAVTLRAESLDGGVHAYGVNAAGDAVGNGTSSVTCPSTVLPILWRADGSRVMLPLGSFCGGNAMGINASGVILGTLSGGAANASGLWVPSDGGYTLQEIAPAPDGYRPIVGRRITDSGEFLGWAQGAARLYWWSSATGWLPIRVPAGATSCVANSAINSLGGIAAYCSIGGGANDGYYWSDHTAAPVLLPRPAGAAGATPRDINDAGVIVGGGGGRAVEWTPNGNGGYSVSFLPDVGNGSFAYAIAEDGTVAGQITRTTNNPRPVIWRPGESNFTYLALPNSGGWGEALAIASGPSGIVVGGSQQNSQAIRWRAAP